MKASILSLALALVVVGAAAVIAQPPVAGKVTLGLANEEVKLVAVGLSAKKQLLDKPVYNDAGEKIGEINDIIVTPEGKVSVVIIGVGGFLGIGQRDVALPVRQLKLAGNKFTVVGATKDALKKLPEFKYAS